MEIHGVVMTRNNWGVIALSIANAFNHVHVIHVLNHGSNDQTAHGLEILKEIWGEKLKIYTSGSDVPWEQAILTNMICSIAELDGADWIYIFDSDEFLISKPNFSLEQELSKLPDTVTAVRYRTSNYISTFDFEINNLNDYRRLVYESIPTHNLNSPKMWELLYEGSLTFFDIQIFPKVIFRANKNLLVTKGAHKLRWNFHGQSILNSSVIDCAHLMLISKDILKSKSAHGDSHIQMGLPQINGLRNQLINKLDSEGRLDWFWERHSIQTEKVVTNNLKYKINHALVECLGTPIKLLEEKFGGINLSMLSGFPLKFGYGEETKFTMNSTFQMCNFFDKKIELLLRLSKKT